MKLTRIVTLFVVLPAFASMAEQTVPAENPPASGECVVAKHGENETSTRFWTELPRTHADEKRVNGFIPTESKLKLLGKERTLDDSPSKLPRYWYKVQFKDAVGWVSSIDVALLCAASKDIPEYQLNGPIGLLVGEVQGDVVIKGISRKTPKDKLADLAKRIVQQHGITQAAFYCTEEAFKANLSAKYGKEHPNALKEGYLGQWRDGAFEFSSF